MEFIIYNGKDVLRNGMGMGIWRTNWLSSARGAHDYEQRAAQDYLYYYN